MTSDLFQKRRINSLQALRAWAFLGIFFLHAKLGIEWSRLGVAVFFVLSGFLMSFRYNKEEISVLPKECIYFALRKIMKLYPLHIITMICAICLLVISVPKTNSLFEVIGKAVLNIALLQSWVPHSSVNTSLNGVAWYLSVMVFLYFIYPWIKRIIEKRSALSLCLISVVILFIQVFSCVPLIYLLGKTSPIYIWFMYCFPVFRLGDFFTGCVLEKVFSSLCKNNIEKIKATIIEIFALVITILLLLWLKQEHTGVMSLALSNWTTMYIPLASMWIIIFTMNKGLLTFVMSNRLTIFIGDVSAYAFLIHYVITQFVSIQLSNMKIELNDSIKVLLIFAELTLTIALSVMYKYFHEKIVLERLKHRTE